MKKLFAFLIIVLILGTMTCAAWADNREDAGLESPDSLRMDVSVVYSMNISMMGETLQDAQVELLGTMAMTLDPERCSMDFTSSNNGNTQHSLMVYEAQGSQYVLYSSLDEGKTWEKQTVSRDFLPNGLVSSIDSFDKIAEFVAEFEQTGTGEIHGRPANLYSGVLSGEQTKEYFAISGSMDSILQPYGIDINEMDPSYIGEMPVKAALDSETGRLLEFDMDMTAFLQKIIQDIMEITLANAVETGELSGVSDIGSLGIAVTINEAIGRTTFYDFNAVEEIQMPKVD